MFRMDRFHLQAASGRTAGAAPVTPKEGESLDGIEPEALRGPGTARTDDGFRPESVAVKMPFDLLYGTSDQQHVHLQLGNVVDAVLAVVGEILIRGGYGHQVDALGRFADGDDSER